MKTKKPLVSILLPVYNAQAHISETLESILAQKYTDFEIIAVDDNSKDQTLKIIKQYRKSDKRIRVYKNLNKYGLRKSLNFALNKSRGEFIAFMPEGGRNYIDRITKQVSFLLKNREFSAVGSQCSFLNDNNKVVSKSSFPTDPLKIQRNLMIGNSVAFGSFMIHRTRLPKDILRFEHDQLPALFSVIFMKIFKYSKIAILQDCLVSYKLSNGNIKEKTKFGNLFLSVKASLNAFLIHDYRPSIRTLLTL